MKSILGIGTAAAVGRARETVSPAAAPISAEVLKRLRELHSRSERALELLHGSGLGRETNAELRTLISSLKDTIGSEYQRLWPIRAQGSLLADEAAYYWPAIAESWQGAGLSELRAASWSKRSWSKTIEAVHAKLTQYLHQIENR